jgi:hypothetical protein
MALCGQSEVSRQRREMRHPSDKCMSTGWMAKRRPRTRGEASSHLGRPAALERCQSLEGRARSQLPLKLGGIGTIDTGHNTALTRLKATTVNNIEPLAQYQNHAGDRIPRPAHTRISLAVQAEVNSRRKGFIRTQASQTDTGIVTLRKHIYDRNGAWEYVRHMYWR